MAQSTGDKRAITKAVVLCAGEGTRLRPFSFSVPKHLVPVANRPVIEWILETLAEAGVQKTAVVVSPFHERVFRESLGERTPQGMILRFVVQEHPRGLAHAVSCAARFIDGDPFLLYLGDNLFECGVAEVVRRYQERACAATIALLEVADPRCFGVARLDGQRILDLVEKPADPPSHWVVAGAYAFSAQILDAISQIQPSARGELEITDAIRVLMKRDDGVTAHLVKGWWKDVGRPEDLILASELLMNREAARTEGEVDDVSNVEGMVVVEAGANVKGSCIRGPCIIGRDACIVDCDLGPNVVIGDRAHVIRSRTERSIVMSDACIERASSLHDSIVGRRSHLSHAAAEPGCAMLIGDDSIVSWRT